MKLAIATILITGVAAFAPSAPIVVARGVATTALFSEPEAEEGGLDLDLGEMFDMFEAADKGTDFDKAIADVKKEKKD